MKNFSQFILEDKETAAKIRRVLKGKYGITSRDASVKTRWGSTSSSVTVTLKTMKALKFKKGIERIGQGSEDISIDQSTGEILQGGNTFVFTEVDFDLKKEMAKKVQELFDNYKDKIENSNKPIKIKGISILKDKSGIYILSIGNKIRTDTDQFKYIGDVLISKLLFENDIDTINKII